MESKLDSFLRKRGFLFSFVHVVLLTSIAIKRKNTLVGISYIGLILFSKIFYVFDGLYVKSSSISCEFSVLNVVGTL